MTDITATATSADHADRGLWRAVVHAGPTGLVVALALTVAEWTLLRSPENSASVTATLAALTMTLPVVLSRRMPVPAVGLLTAAALANGLAFGGDLIRCGGAFPALVYAAYAVGAYSRSAGRGWGRPLTGLTLAIAAVGIQFQWDRALHADPWFLAMGSGAVLVAWGLGLGWAGLSRRRSRG